MYYIVRLNEDGNWDYLNKYFTYDEADNAIDRYWNKYPNAYIDILSYAELNSHC